MLKDRPMPQANTSFGENTAELYDKLLTPIIFAPCAQYVSDIIQPMQPSRILELAAGTGILTRAMAGKLREEVEIVATDISEPMINVARSQSGEFRNVEWKQVDANSLSAFEDGSFDLVVCQFGIMFFRDKVGALQEARRVLAPGGKCVYTVWDDWEKMLEAPYHHACQKVAQVLHCEPRELANPPYFDTKTIQDHFAAAQFQDVMIDRIELPSEAASAHDAATAFVFGSLMRNTLEKQSVIALEEAKRAAEEALIAKFGAGYIVGDVNALVITATK